MIQIPSELLDQWRRESWKEWEYSDMQCSSASFCQSYSCQKAVEWTLKQVMAFIPNKYARCECELAGETDPPICTFFEDANDPDVEDCCKVCRHAAECHLKGHEPEVTK